MAKRKESLLQIVMVRLFIVFVLIVALSYLARYLWLAELLSHFRVQYAIVAAIFTVIFFFFKRKSLLICLSIAIMSSQIYSFYHLFIPNQDAKGMELEQIKILQYNVYRDNSNVDEMLNWIVARSDKIDIVVLFEVNEFWISAMQRLKWIYPYSLSRVSRGDRETFILSKLLIDEMETKSLGQYKKPALIMRGVTTKHELPFVIYAIHPHTPILPSYLSMRDDLLLGSARAIKAEKVPYKIWVGDFNTSTFSPIFKSILAESQLIDSGNGFGVAGTWPSFMPKPFRISTDHLLVSDNIRAVNKEVGSKAMGSDHLPVITTLKLYSNDASSADISSEEKKDKE